MQTTKRRVFTAGGAPIRRRMDSRSAYILMTRFLSNPCPNIARIILDNRSRIAEIAREYRAVLSRPGYASGYAEGVALFLRVFDQVEMALTQLRYQEANSVDETTYQGIRIARGNRC